MRDLSNGTCKITRRININWVKVTDQKTGRVKIELPDNATKEQKKAYKKYLKRCEQARHDMSIIEE